MIICGIDEAGRGPVIGPMVIAIVCVENSEIEKLRKIGVKDSKMLKPEKRTNLFSKIKKIAKFVDYVIVSSEEIDRYVSQNMLNRLELEKIIQLIKKVLYHFNNVKVFIDSPTINSTKFKNELKKVFKDVDIEVMHKADQNITIVSAASIVAKCIRDSEIEKMKVEYGDFGSGYPSDPRTIKFIISYYANHGELPPIVRKSWKTCKRIIDELRKSKLF